jgi:phosphoglycolate phosphatase
MRDTLWVNEAQIRLFSNSNISLEEMKITGEALLRCRYIKEHDCGIFRSDECDPNILGIISDMALQVAEFSLVTVFGHVSGGYRLSVRSCTKEVMADDFIRFITKDIGSGGGHSFKAGGFISEDKLKESFPGLLPEEYLDQAVERYFDSFTIIHAQSYHPDMSRFSRYVKNRMVLGYIAPSSFLEKNTRIRVRTLEGDTELFVDESFYLMVGFLGEVYPIKKEKFEAGYEQTEEEFTGRMEYVPRIYAGPEGKVYELYEHMKPCASTGKAFIMASELTQAVKLFTEWYDEKYMKGEPGDYMACRADDPNDFYIIRRDIFELTYSPA